MHAASAHLVTAATVDDHSVLDRARHCVSETYGVAHGTFQIEPEQHEGCDRVGW
jgi:cobalt-zinc-cadmium efflux system protein